MTPQEALLVKNPPAHAGDLGSQVREDSLKESETTEPP